MKFNFSTVLLFCLVCISCILQVKALEQCTVSTVKMKGILSGDNVARGKYKAYCSYNYVKQTDRDCNVSRGNSEITCTGLVYCKCKFKHCCYS